MVNRIEIERLLQSKEMKKLWQTIQQELPQLHFMKKMTLGRKHELITWKIISPNVILYSLSATFKKYQ